MIFNINILHKKFIYLSFIIIISQTFYIFPYDKFLQASENPKPYFLLVCSSYQNQLDKFDIEKIKVINESPYHGIAVRIIWEFDDTPFNFDNFKKNAEFIKKNTNKQIWPWVFLNRMIGTDEKNNDREVIKDKPYFHKIKGMDLYDETKALSDFYALWRSSLRLAKIFSSPGVVFDIEAYNYYPINKISYLAKKHNKSSEDIKKQLRIVGSKLIDIAAEEYPEIIIWFLFTHLGNSPPSWYPSSEKYMSVSYIAESMISEAEKRSLPMKFVSGGQIGLGYCYKSLEDMNDKIKKRQGQFKLILTKHPKLYLGGTIAPWNDTKLKRGWMKEKVCCCESTLKNMDDFVPLIRNLANNYDYVWIYATQMTGYNPYDREISYSFNKAITHVLSEKSIDIK